MDAVRAVDDGCAGSTLAEPMIEIARAALHRRVRRVAAQMANGEPVEAESDRKIAQLRAMEAEKRAAQEEHLANVEAAEAEAKRMIAQIRAEAAEKRAAVAQELAHAEAVVDALESEWRVMESIVRAASDTEGNAADLALALNANERVIEAEMHAPPLEEILRMDDDEYMNAVRGDDDVLAGDDDVLAGDDDDLAGDDDVLAGDDGRVAARAVPDLENWQAHILVRAADIEARAADAKERVAKAEAAVADAKRVMAQALSGVAEACAILPQLQARALSMVEEVKSERRETEVEMIALNAEARAAKSCVRALIAEERLIEVEEREAVFAARAPVEEMRHARVAVVLAGMDALMRFFPVV